MKIPNRIKELRERSRLTQEELGKLLGVDATTISKHETGDRALSDDKVMAYAKVFKVSTHEIFVNLEGD